MSTPLGGSVTVLAHDEDGVTTAYQISADEPVLAGHYPGFVIFPGVCLVEFVHQSTLAAGRLRSRALTLTAVESTRFRGPVFPGDEVTSRVEIAERDGGWRASATLSSRGRPVAQVRLRYATEGPT